MHNRIPENCAVILSCSETQGCPALASLNFLMLLNYKTACTTKRDWVMNFLKWQILLCKPLVSLWMPFNIFSFGINFILLLPMRKWKMFTILLVRSAVSMTKSHPSENPQVLLPAMGGQSCGCTEVQFCSDSCAPVASYWETQMRSLILKGYSTRYPRHTSCKRQGWLTWKYNRRNCCSGMHFKPF